MWKDENGYVYTEEDLFNLALEECHSEDSAYDYIDTLIEVNNLEEICRINDEIGQKKSTLIGLVFLFKN